MNGVMIPEVSAGSNQVGASEMWTPQVTWPSGAAAPVEAPRTERKRGNNAMTRTRAIFMVEPPVCGWNAERYADCPSCSGRCQGHANGATVGRPLAASTFMEVSHERAWVDLGRFPRPRAR